MCLYFSLCNANYRFHYTIVILAILLAKSVYRESVVSVLSGAKVHSHIWSPDDEMLE